MTCAIISAIKGTLQLVFISVEEMADGREAIAFLLHVQEGLPYQIRQCHALAPHMMYVNTLVPVGSHHTVRTSAKLTGTSLVVHVPRAQTGTRALGRLHAFSVKTARPRRKRNVTALPVQMARQGPTANALHVPLAAVQIH